MTQTNPHKSDGGTRLSDAYSMGLKGLPCPKWAGDRTSAAHKAWKRGRDESIAEKLIGREVSIKITRDDHFYRGHWGFIKSYEGDGNYIIAGGSLGNLEPIKHRSELILKRRKQNADDN